MLARNAGSEAGALSLAERVHMEAAVPTLVTPARARGPSAAEGVLELQGAWEVELRERQERLAAFQRTVDERVRVRRTRADANAREQAGVAVAHLQHLASAMVCSGPR